MVVLCLCTISHGYIHAYTTLHRRCKEANQCTMKGDSLCSRIQRNGRIRTLHVRWHCVTRTYSCTQTHTHTRCLAYTHSFTHSLTGNTCRHRSVKLLYLSRSLLLFPLFLAHSVRQCKRQQTRTKLKSTIRWAASAVYIFGWDGTAHLVCLWIFIQSVVSIFCCACVFRSSAACLYSLHAKYIVVVIVSINSNQNRRQNEIASTLVLCCE